jgi:hypothetical protein
MIPISLNHPSIYVKLQQVKPEWGVSGEGERKKEREQRINGVRDGALDRNGNGVGY